jgi:DNA-binding NtrC family response regulator
MKAASAGNQTSTIPVNGAIDVSSSLSSTSGDSAKTIQAVPSGSPVSLSEALEEPERRIILEALKARNWNRNETAVALGINRTTLYKKIKRLGIEELIPG